MNSPRPHFKTPSANPRGASVLARARKLLFVLAAAACFGVLSAGSARADTVNFSGHTTGCFGAGCTPVGFSSSQGLSYTQTAFTVSVSSGQVAHPNLGTVALTGTAAVYDGQSFRLDVFFGEGVANPGSASFGATLTGTVSAAGDGSVTFDFDDTPLVGSYFVDAECARCTRQQRYFLFYLNDLTVTAGGTGSVTGTVQPLPEPATMLLLGTGLFAAGAGRRYGRRRGK